MADEEFQIGDVVMLKSGGPRMTIAAIDTYSYDTFKSANCDWFVADKSPWKKDNGLYPLTSLKKVE